MKLLLFLKGESYDAPPGFEEEPFRHHLIDTKWYKYEKTRDFGFRVFFVRGIRR